MNKRKILQNEVDSTWREKGHAVPSKKRTYTPKICPSCGGIGFIGKEVCSQCNGEGEIIGRRY